MRCHAYTDLIRGKKVPPKFRWNVQQYTVAHNSFIYRLIHKRNNDTQSLQCTDLPLKAAQLDLQQLYWWSIVKGVYLRNATHCINMHLHNDGTLPASHILQR